MDNPPLSLSDFRQLALPGQLRKWVSGMMFVSALASAQELVRPAIDPSTPLIEAGTAPSEGTLRALPATPPAEILKPAEEEVFGLPRADDNAPLPTDVPPVNTDGTSSGREAGQRAAEPIGPMTPLLTANAPVEPTIPPMMNNSKRVQFSLDVESIYDDNVFFSSKNPVTDYIFVASPKLTLQRGDFRAKEESYGILNYNPQAIYFTKGTDDNTLDQNLKAEVQYTIARLAVGFDASYQRLSGATPDLGNRVDRDLAAAKLRFTYGWGAKMEVETSFLYTTTNYDPKQLADFSEFVNETFLRYQVSARTKAALGVGVGRLNVEGFGHQTFERALVQIMSEVSSKLTLKAKGGVEFRHTELGDLTTPIFSLALDYKIRASTTLALEAYREVNASGGSPGENLTRTGVAAKLSQRLGSRFVGNLAVGYDQLSYAATSKAQSAAGSRDDAYFFIRPSVQYELREGRRLELYYLHRQNDSNSSDADFEGNQIGLSAGLDF